MNPPTVSPRRPCPGPENVLGGVNIPVFNIPTRTTDVSPYGERLLDDFATVRAPLRREVRRYLVHPAASTLGLAVEYRDEVGPACVRDGLREVVVVDHTTDVEVFDRNNGVAINVRPRRLVRMVLALASDLEMPFGDMLCSLLASLRTLLTARELAQCPSELLLRSPVAARVLDRLAFGVCKKDLEAIVEANGGTVSFLRRFSEITDYEHVPAPIGPENEVCALGSAFMWPVLFDLDPAAELLRNVKPPSFRVKKHIATGSVLPEMYRVPAVRRLEAWETDLLSKLSAVKEPLEGFVQTVGKRLHRALRYILSAPTLEPIREVVPAEELARLAVLSLDHLKHLVVNPAALRQVRKELCMLDAVGIKPVFKGSVHPLSSTASGYCAQRLFSSCLKAPALGPIFL